ncbi:hypothetical protein CIPAW_13G064800 [Carya illinoinensis]|uniref:Uncharacterized protein n=1 Tax=Carya illinoinensis TaxID=32201 RepID=A0A8T1NHE7_CARIL|nr:hypothetical protein CIPAW_13G064800 [Carya illinoinensis]
MLCWYHFVGGTIQDKPPKKIKLEEGMRQMGFGIEGKFRGLHNKAKGSERLGMMVEGTCVGLCINKWRRRNETECCGGNEASRTVWRSWHLRYYDVSVIYMTFNVVGGCLL